MQREEERPTRKLAAGRADGAAAVRARLAEGRAAAATALLLEARGGGRG